MIRILSLSFKYEMSLRNFLILRIAYKVAKKISKCRQVFRDFVRNYNTNGCDKHHRDTHVNGNVNSAHFDELFDGRNTRLLGSF
jgi:hypothetical protein